MRIRGTDGKGQPFIEQRVTLEVSYQGCRYFSRYALPPNSSLTVEISNKRTASTSAPVRARVAWLRKEKTLQGLFQVGVEFEEPGNVWGLANPPEDWRAPVGDAPARFTAPSATQLPDAAAFEREMKELLALAGNRTYYQLLRVTSESPRAQVRQNYHELVRKFHPDRHMKRADSIEPLQKLMESLTAAYKTLSDDAERQKYDERLASSSAFLLGRQQNQLQKTAEECMEKARECLMFQNNGGAILWLRKATELEPKSAKYRALLARALSAVPAFRREAAEHFEKAVELEPVNAPVRMQLAALYEEMKLPWRARAHYLKILEIDVENGEARKRLECLEDGTGSSGAGKRSFLERIFRQPPK